MDLIPYHIEVCSIDGELFRIFLHKQSDEFLAILEDSEGSNHDAGSWPTYSDAVEFAKMLAKDLTLRSPQALESVRRHKRRGALLVIAVDSLDSRWSIIAGYRPYRWDDLGLRFNTQEEAKEVLRCA
jgi:hypothetical protein